MTWTEDCTAASQALTPEKRKEFMGYLKGNTIGEAREKADISFDAAIGTINANIDEVLFLKPLEEVR